MLPNSPSAIEVADLQAKRQMENVAATNICQDSEITRIENNSSESTTNYAFLLEAMELEHRISDFYWQVGEISMVQGWILHLSTIKTQIPNLLRVILPILKTENVPFKIIKDSHTAELLLDGNLGSINIGKVISIYPTDSAQGLKLAKRLIKLTSEFKGPSIPTDYRLGGIVYTRYGSFNPIFLDSPSGVAIKHIYSHNGELIPDPYEIPFSFPRHVNWPFSEIAPSTVRKTPKLLNYKYYPITVIKNDAKGSVLKALYFRRFWSIKSCIIKQGKQNMFTDNFGRDIQDRLQWQYNLTKSLENEIPLPKAYDHFTESGDSYLVLEYIKGISTYAWVQEVYNNHTWLDLDDHVKDKLVEVLSSIITIVQKLHAKKYIHRDVTPDNFLITKQMEIYLIDMELTWSETSQLPSPPFGLGTHGFISPEQIRLEQPTNKEDVYAIGALMLFFLTNMHPAKFAKASSNSLEQKLSFFVPSKDICLLISECLNPSPALRPTLESVKSRLKLSRKSLHNQPNRRGDSNAIPAPNNDLIRSVVPKALNGLTANRMLNVDKQWISNSRQTETNIGNEQLNTTLSVGWHTGMAGPLWLVALARKYDFNVDPCKSVYFNCWDYIQMVHFHHDQFENKSLFTGGAGIALALAAGAESGLLERNREFEYYLKSCFDTNIDNPTLSAGLSGQGLAIIKTCRHLGLPVAQEMLDRIAAKLIGSQQPDGSWNTGSIHKKQDIAPLNLENGIAGICLFLLSYYDFTKNDQAKICVSKALNWLISHSKKIKNIYVWSKMNASRTANFWHVLQGIPGLTFLFIKAYEVLKYDIFKEIAQGNLLQLPRRPIRSNFELGNGLAGLGELFLEGYKTFNDEAWLQRAQWIAHVFLNCFIEEPEGIGYWSIDTGTVHTADLFSGNSGILHFMIRYLNQNSMPHPLIPEISDSTNF